MKDFDKGYCLGGLSVAAMVLLLSLLFGGYYC